MRAVYPPLRSDPRGGLVQISVRQFALVASIFCLVSELFLIDGRQFLSNFQFCYGTLHGAQQNFPTDGLIECAAPAGRRFADGAARTLDSPRNIEWEYAEQSRHLEDSNDLGCRRSLGGTVVHVCGLRIQRRYRFLRRKLWGIFDRSVGRNGSRVAGLIGWGVSSSKSVCAGLGTVALLASVAVCILGSLAGSTNVHGPFLLIFLPMLLISLLRDSCCC